MLALFAVTTGCIVLTVITHATGHVTRQFEYFLVEVTSRSVIVAVTFLTLVFLFSERRLPLQVVVQVLAFLAVQPRCIVGAFAFAMHHVRLDRKAFFW